MIYFSPLQLRSSAFGALSTEIEQSMWEAEVLRSFDAAERDAQESVNFNDENHKGHFRLGMARLEVQPFLCTCFSYQAC